MAACRRAAPVSHAAARRHAPLRPAPRSILRAPRRRRRQRCAAAANAGAGGGDADAGDARAPVLGVPRERFDIIARSALPIMGGMVRGRH